MTPAISTDSLLALQFRSARPGLDLVTIIDAGLPIAMITADVLARDSKPLPLLEEFVLRLVSADVTTEEEIAGFLGVSQETVAQAIADHLVADNLSYAPAGYGGAKRQKLQLTDRGTMIARELASITSKDLSLPLIYDQLLCRVKSYDRSAILRRRDAEDDGLLLVPSARSSPVESSDVSASEINALLHDGGDVHREVLSVKKVSQQAQARRIMPAKVLVFADPDRSNIQLAVVVDDKVSPAHETALLNQGGAAALGIRVEAPVERPTLDPELERARVPLLEVIRQQTTYAAAIRLGKEIPAHEQPPAAAAQGEEVRAVSAFEHPGLLQEALTQATQRILLISPWVRRAVLTADFLSKLESRLRRDVTVHIAHGSEEDDSGSDADAIRRLHNLASRYPDHLTLVRLRNTHAKVLIFDSTWINTSFNWLSYRGDRSYRVEEGTLVRGQRVVDAQYERYIAQLGKHRQ